MLGRVQRGMGAGAQLNPTSHLPNMSGQLQLRGKRPVHRSGCSCGMTIAESADVLECLGGKADTLQWLQLRYDSRRFSGHAGMLSTQCLTVHVPLRRS